MEARFRGDWKCGEERWGLFSDTRYRIDEFQNFDTRLTESLGGTYRIYENEGEKKWNLDAVFGGGFRLDSGLSDPNADEFVPEGNIGFRGSMEPSERQTLKGSLFLYPDLDGLEDYRTFTNIDWNYMLDPDQACRSASTRTRSTTPLDWCGAPGTSKSWFRWSSKSSAGVSRPNLAFHLWQLASKPENAPSGARFHAVPGGILVGGCPMAS